jgi:hypothetical protein
MKKLFFLIGVVLVLVSCKKDVLNEATDTANSVIQNFDEASNARRLSYADTIFYKPSSGSNFFIRPTSRPRIAGYYQSIPAGLMLDSATGRINVTRSQSGIRYKVCYFSLSTRMKVDSTKLIISGIDYTDGIYTLSVGQDTAFPIYNADPSAGLPCFDDDDDDEEDDGCDFDETDLDDDGDDEVGGVNAQKLLVSKSNGTIDLAASISAGLLGANPVNGSTGDYLFYYRLNDFTQRALQSITVRVYYYNTVADIPQGLLDTLQFRNTQLSAVNSFRYSGEILPSNYSMSIAAGSSGLSELTSDQLYVRTYSRPKRPPVIIITAN